MFTLKYCFICLLLLFLVARSAKSLEEDSVKNDIEKFTKLFSDGLLTGDFESGKHFIS